MARPAIGANVGLSVALEATPRATCRAMSPNRGTRDLSQLPTSASWLTLAHSSNRAKTMQRWEVSPREAMQRFLQRDLKASTAKSFRAGWVCTR